MQVRREKKKMLGADKWKASNQTRARENKSPVKKGKQ